MKKKLALGVAVTVMSDTLHIVVTNTTHQEKRMTERDPRGTDPHSPGAKLDANKTLAWLCLAGFSHAMQEVAAVTTAGAVKYTPNGWVSVPDGKARYMEAFARHMLALGKGEVKDADTGCLHKAQMIWNLLASLELELRDAQENQA